MLKLYRNQNGRVTHYHGTRGEQKQHSYDKELGESESLRRVLKSAAESGYQPLGSDGHEMVLVEYKIDGFGTAADLKKRHDLQDHLDETLGWTGLGKVDGGSIGSGTMEVCCFVVDVEVAMRVIAEDLRRTKFGDYSRIYAEGAG
jgi:hypothetical protein